MSLYALDCDRCDKKTTHEEVSHFDDDVPEEAKKQHPRYDTEVYCRDCAAGRSKGDIPEDGAEIWFETAVTQSLTATIHPEDIDEGDSLLEHLDKLAKERREEVVREIADGIRVSQIERDGRIKTDDMDGWG